MSASSRFIEAPGTEVLDLLPGQRWQQRLRLGTRLQLLQGRVRLTEPSRWLGEQVLQLALPLQAGHAHALGETGWVQLEALPGAGPVRLVLCRPQPWWQRAWLRALSVRLAGRPGARKSAQKPRLA